MKEIKRFTRKNVGTAGSRQTYRVWLDHAGEFRIDTQGGEAFMFGDMINRLGELEDLAEELEAIK